MSGDSNSVYTDNIVPSSIENSTDETKTVVADAPSSTEVEPTTKQVADQKEEVTEPDTTIETIKVEEPVPSTTPVKEVTPVYKESLDFYIGTNNAAHRISYLRRFINAILDKSATTDIIEDSFQYAVKLNLINPNAVFQYPQGFHRDSLIPSIERERVNLVFTIFTMILENKKNAKKIDIAPIRSMLKSETFAKWVISKR